MRTTRLVLTSLLLALTTTAFDFAPFLNALSLPITVEDYIPPAFDPNNGTSQLHDNLKRQLSDSCPSGFDSCSNLGAPGLCCASAATCTPDSRGNVACCPTGSVCTGQIGGVITAGTVNSVGSLVSGSVTSGQPTRSVTRSGSTSPGVVTASTVTSSGSGFIVAGSSTVALPAGAGRAADIVSLCREACFEACIANRSTAIRRKSYNTSVGVCDHLILPKCWDAWMGYEVYCSSGRWLG